MISSTNLRFSFYWEPPHSDILDIVKEASFRPGYPQRPSAQLVLGHDILRGLQRSEVNEETFLERMVTQEHPSSKWCKHH